MDDLKYDLSNGRMPNAYIQWKGTDVCLDFECECGWSGHFDGEFAYVLVCGGCEREWEMPATVPLRKNERPGDGGPKVHPEAN